MTDATENPPEKTKGKGKLLLVLSVVLALAGAGGGYFAVAGGVIPLKGETGAQTAAPSPESGGHPPEGLAGAAPPVDVAFVEVEPLTISLRGGADFRHLRFRAQLEVVKGSEGEVAALLPRVVDIMNGYLRALETGDLTGPLALVRLRAQLLRRIQIVAGGDRVRDLLVMEFVLN